ncbi:hypothetical protein EJ063_06275 [Vibrio aquaticus]|uniref:Sel1 repeat family protein n=1 Tax=Vibrio aquaticus TaxID=2496559 RepID=A0A3S0PP19_9VIBR|nr:hypothetical protein [Vibrio aquaticus]RTZ16406.1 hypothetical protein EJ063_06275 [Vibrio aquaticus]
MSILVRALLLAGTCLLFFSKSLVAGETYSVETMSPDEAYQRGRLLKAQFKNREAREYLKSAADRGHGKSGYLYAMELRRTGYLQRDQRASKDYLIRSAEQGNRQALRYLHLRGDWLTAAEQESYQQRYFDDLIRLGATQPSLAYFLLSEFYLSVDGELSNYYLEKSMEFDFAKAYMEGARRIERGEIDFMFAAKSERIMKQYYQQAANLDYLPALRKLVLISEKEGNFQQALEWRKKALDLGDISSLISMYKIYSGSSSQYPFVEIDRPRSLAYLMLYLETAGDSTFSAVYRQAKVNQSELATLASEAQMAEAKKLKIALSEGVVFYHHDGIWEDLKY